MNKKSSDLDVLVDQAKTGSMDALMEIVNQIQHDIYRLSMKMLWHPEDAEDATQEILIRIITHLSSFRGESAFKTWVYRISVNYLLTTRKRQAEAHTMTFAEFGKDLYDGLSDTLQTSAVAAEQALLVKEIKIGCTQGMLLCLDRDHRIAYILGEIFQLTGEQGGKVLDITPVAFRKRLSRARTSIRQFMQQQCGLVNRENRCRCRRRIDRAVKLGRVDPQHLLFATHPIRAGEDATIQHSVREIEELEQTAAQLHRQPYFAAPKSLWRRVKSLVDSGKYQVFT